MSGLFEGHRAALSLTFDDALQCQLDHAIPEMDRYGIQGTFFAIPHCPEYPLNVTAWRAAFARGHELGSHSFSHQKAATLNSNTAFFEAAESKRLLEHHFDGNITSYCYPFTDAPEFLQQAVAQAGYKQARGGRVARQDKYVRKGEYINLLNVPCFHVNSGVFDHGEITAWVDAALERNAWLTLMFHGVGDETQWDNVPRDKFVRFMAFLRGAKERGLWVAPFGVVAENFRLFGR